MARFLLFATTREVVTVAHAQQALGLLLENREDRTSTHVLKDQSMRPPPQIRLRLPFTRSTSSCNEPPQKHLTVGQIRPRGTSRGKPSRRRGCRWQWRAEPRRRRRRTASGAAAFATVTEYGIKYGQNITDRLRKAARRRLSSRTATDRSVAQHDGCDRCQHA
jgi:hypothetical protein